ncbi:MAG: hypothetical protein H6839_04230 [Planctomycetes bacterium]|nr:hypothetical protein [Planctomycetota bacterium]
MKLRKLDVADIQQLAAHASLKGECLLLPGTLSARAELEELPKELIPNLPGVILCKACGAYIERLLNERGVVVTSPADPVDAVPDGADVELDLVGGALTELSSGRRFALSALKPDHLKFVRTHG